MIRTHKICEINDYFTDKINGGDGVLSKNGKTIHCSKCNNYSKQKPIDKY